MHEQQELPLVSSFGQFHSHTARGCCVLAWIWNILYYKINEDLSYLINQLHFHMETVSLGYKTQKIFVLLFPFTKSNRESFEKLLKD